MYFRSFLIVKMGMLSLFIVILPNEKEIIDLYLNIYIAGI